MPIGTSPNRGRNPMVNSAAIVKPVGNGGEVTFPAGSPLVVTSREIVIGIDAGVHIGLWVLMTAGAVPVTVLPEFLYQQSQIKNTPDWQPIDQLYTVAPVGGGPTRRQWTHPARRFRATFTAAASGTAFKYYFFTWAA